MMAYCQKGGSPAATAQPTGTTAIDGRMLETLVSRLSNSLNCGAQVRSTVPVSFCCVPLGCTRYLDSPIIAGSPDAVRITCSNPDCGVGKWMHLRCFSDWGRLMGACIRSCVEIHGKGCGEDGVERRKRFEVALRACVCLCGKGYVCKDFEYYESQKQSGTQQPLNQERMLRERAFNLSQRQPQQPVMQSLKITDDLKRALFLKPDSDRCPRSSLSSNFCSTSSSSTVSSASPFDQSTTNEVRLRTFSFSSTGSSLASSNATPPPISPRRSDHHSISTPSRSPTPTPEVTPLTSASGNIFRHRTDLSAFRCLPKVVQNPYHIKVEDDGPHGNDKIRGFLLTNLTRNHVTEVHCAVCKSALPVFDEFPLIDGTFFLSPRPYSDRMSVVFERRMVYLNAVCLGCLDGSKTRLRCQGCLTPWDGSSLILGTMYSYDVFGAMACCRRRLSCLGCGQPVDEPENLKFFSDYSRLVRCESCHLEDYHFLKQLDEIFFYKTM